MNLRILKKQCKKAAGQIRKHCPRDASKLFQSDGEDTLYGWRGGPRYIEPLRGTWLVETGGMTDCGYEADCDAASRIWDEMKFWMAGFGYDKQFANWEADVREREEAWQRDHAHLRPAS